MNYYRSLYLYLAKLFSSTRLYVNLNTLKIMGLGFSCAVPVSLIFSVIITYLSDSQIDLKTVGFFSVACFPFTLKFLWAPLLDNLRIAYFTKRLGQRKSWILFLQIGLMISIYSLGQINIHSNLLSFAVVVVLIAILSASQDIVVDALRIEMLPQAEQNFGVAVVSFGYRTGLIITSAGALSIAHYYDWNAAYNIMALGMIIGIIATLSCIEARHFISQLQPKHLLAKNIFLNPFKDFLKKKKWHNTMLLITFFKMSDAFAGVMGQPFLLDIGFDKREIANVVGLYGLSATLVGVLICGFMLKHITYKKVLLIACTLQMLSNLGYALQAKIGRDYTLLILNISIDNMAACMVAASIIAYMGSICNREFTATQFAFCSSLAGVPRTTIASYSGVIAQNLGWAGFFIFSMVMTTPVLYFLHQEFKLVKNKFEKPPYL